MKPSFYGLLFAISTTVLIVFSNDAKAQNIKLIAPSPPGVVIDIAARLIAIHVAKISGQTPVVENRPGADGLIGIGIVAKSPKNENIYGLLTAGTFEALRHPNNLSLNIQDIQPITLIGISGLVIAVPASASTKTIEELVQLGKTKTLSAGALGENSISHKCITIFSNIAGIRPPNIQHYKGFAPLVTDLMTGNLEYSCVAEHLFSRFSHRLTPLAVTLPDPSSFLPNVPTLEMKGIQGVPVGDWMMLVMPRNANSQAANALVSNLRKVFSSDSVFRNRMLEIYIHLLPPSDIGPEIAENFLRRQISQP